MPVERFANLLATPASDADDHGLVGKLSAAVATAPAALTVENWTLDRTVAAELRSGVVHCRVDNEIVLMTIPSTGASPVSVLRGAEGSTTAVHAIGAKIREVITADVLRGDRAAHTTGRWYGPDLPLMYVDRATQVYAGRMQAVSFVCRTREKLGALGAYVNGSAPAGSWVEFIVWEDNGYGRLGKVVWTSGTVPTTSINTAVIATTGGLWLPPGRYWAGIMPGPGPYPTLRAALTGMYPQGGQYASDSRPFGASAVEGTLELFLSIDDGAMASSGAWVPSDDLAAGTTTTAYFPWWRFDA
jgi:hypothetical protein